jgi:hypothetical protein
MADYVCRHCGSPDIDAEERVPRFIAIAIDGVDKEGQLDWRHDPTESDEAVWESSETIRFRCAACSEAADDLADLVVLVPTDAE